MHLDKDTAGTVKGVVMINTKCGKTVPRAESTIWWRDVDCAECRPHQWVPDTKGVGLKLIKRPSKRVESTPTPDVKVLRRRRPKG